MRNKYVLFLILILVPSLSYSGCGKLSGSESDGKLKSAAGNFKIPVYIGAQKIKHYSRANGSLMGVSYNVKLPYDTKLVLDFYDEKMKEIGFKPFVEEYYKYADRSWQNFTDGTIKGDPEVAQLLASWVDEKNTQRANLALRYFWYIDQNQRTKFLGPNDDLNVDFQIMPFITIPPPQKINPTEGK